MIRNLATIPARATARLACANVSASLLAAVLAMGVSTFAEAQERRPAGAQPQRSQQAQPAPAQEAPKPVLVATIGDWSVYVAAAGRDKQCYALAQPKERAPANLKRDPAYLFISSRPAEKVRHEVSIIMGFDVKAADKIQPEAQIGTDKFALAAQGQHLWIRDANRAGPMIDALRKGSRLTVKATSMRGNLTTDSYSLNGLAGALDRVQRECP